MPRRACLTSARFTMICDIIKPAGSPESNETHTDNTGTWEWRQDPDSGAIVKRWVDNPETVDLNEARSGSIIPDVPLMARGVLTAGIQGAGSTERFDEIYHNVDWVKATFGKGTNITKRDRITNIRHAKTKELLWKEEEIGGYPATTFEVMGVTPVFDPFNNLIEHAVLMQRAEVQGGA